MKNFNFLKVPLILSVLCMILVFTACKDDSSTEVQPVTEASSKDKLVEDGNTLVTSLEKLKDDDFFLALLNLNNLTDGNEEITVISEGIAKSINELDLKSLGVPTTARISDDNGDETLEYLWDDLVGTHTYNPSKDDFDYVEGGNSIVVQFPSEEEGTENNVTLTISDFTTIDPKTDNIVNDLEYAGGLPTSIAASMAIDGTVGMTYNTSISYGDDDIPTNITASLTLGGFSTNLTYNNDGSTVEYSYNFKDGDDILWLNSISISGNVSFEDLASLEEDEDLSVLNLNNATFINQVVNTKVEVILADVNEFASDIEALDNSSDSDLENLLNEHISVNVTFADTNQKVGEAAIELDADGEFDFILTYDDGTKVAITDFIDSGFEDLESDLEDLIADL